MVACSSESRAHRMYIRGRRYWPFVQRHFGGKKGRSVDVRIYKGLEVPKNEPGVNCALLPPGFSVPSLGFYYRPDNPSDWNSPSSMPSSPQHWMSPANSDDWKQSGATPQSQGALSSQPLNSDVASEQARQLANAQPLNSDVQVPWSIAVGAEHQSFSPVMSSNGSNSGSFAVVQGGASSTVTSSGGGAGFSSSSGGASSNSQSAYGSSPFSTRFGGDVGSYAENPVGTALAVAECATRLQQTYGVQLDKTVGLVGYSMGHDFGMGQTFKSGWLSPHHAGKHGPQLGEVVREVLLAQVVESQKIDSLPKGREANLTKHGNSITYFPTAESFNVVRETALQISETSRQAKLLELQVEIAEVEAALPHGASISSEVLNRILDRYTVTQKVLADDYSAEARWILNRDGWGQGYCVCNPDQGKNADAHVSYTGVNLLQEHEGIKAVKAVYRPIYSAEHKDYTWKETTLYPDIKLHEREYPRSPSVKTSMPLSDAITPTYPSRNWV